MICEITGAHKKCISHNIVPCADPDNKTEKILGCPLKEYEPFILTISEDVYKARYRGTIQKRFVERVYDKHGKDELMRLIEVLDVLKCEALIRLFAFGILVKNHGIYKPIESKGTWTTIGKECYNRHYRRLSVMLSFKTRHNLHWTDVSNIVGKKATNYLYGRTHLYNDRIWLPIKAKLEMYERSKK